MSEQGQEPRLFDELVRTDHRRPRRTEPAFEYLNTTARDEGALARRCYEAWFTRFPVDERDGLASRFRSADGSNHTGAAFELALHEVLVRLGCSVDIPPDVRGQPRHDFDAMCAGESVALEATVVTDESEREVKHRRRHDLILDYLDEAHHPRFGILVWECNVAENRTPRKNGLRKKIVGFLDAATDEDARAWSELAANRDYWRLPKQEISREGLKLVYSPIPLHPGAPVDGLVHREDPRPSAVRVTIGDAMRGKLHDKAKKGYDVGERPLVIAVAVTHWAGADSFEDFRALLGTEHHHHAVVDGQHISLGASRDRECVWGEHSRHQHNSISAVLVFRRFRVWHPWTTSWMLYINPEARYPVSEWMRKLPRWERAADPYDGFTDGLHLADVLRPT